MNDFEFKEPEQEVKKRGRAVKAVQEILETPEPQAEEVLQLTDDESPEYDPAELDAIFDQMMFEGQYTEDLTLGKGRFKVTLRTRTGKEAREVMGILDKGAFRMGVTVEGYRSLYNLAQSVVVLNGRDMSGETLERRIERIEALPTPVISALMTQLIKFDLKTEAAVRHGEENF